MDGRRRCSWTFEDGRDAAAASEQRSAPSLAAKPMGDAYDRSRQLLECAPVQQPGSATPATTNHGSLTTYNSESKAYGRGAGVGRGRGVGTGLGVALGLPVGVAVGEGGTVAVGVAVAVAVGVAVAIAVAVGVTVAVALGVGLLITVADGLGVGVGLPPAAQKISIKSVGVEGA